MEGIIKKTGVGMHVMVPKDRGFNLGDTVIILSKSKLQEIQDTKQIVCEMAEHLKKKPIYQATSASTVWAPTEIEMSELVRNAVFEVLKGLNR